MNLTFGHEQFVIISNRYAMEREWGEKLIQHFSEFLCDVQIITQDKSDS